MPKSLLDRRLPVAAHPPSCSSLWRDEIVVNTTRRWAIVGHWGMVIGAVLCLALIGGGLHTYPAAFLGGGPEAGPTSVMLALGLLIVYVAAGGVAGRAARLHFTVAVGEGTRVGAVIGGVWLVSHTVEVFTDGTTLPSSLFLGTVFLLFGVAGFVGARRAGRIGVGVLAAVWAAMSSSLLLVIYGFLLAYLFMSRMAAIEATDLARSGMHEAAAFTVANTIFSAGSHLLEAPVIAAGLGMIGSLAGRVWYLRQSAATPSSRT